MNKRAKNKNKRKTKKKTMNKNWILNKCFQNNIIKNRKKKSFLMSQMSPFSLTLSHSLTILNHILKKRNTFNSMWIEEKHDRKKKSVKKKQPIFCCKTKKNVLRNFCGLKKRKEKKKQSNREIKKEKKQLRNSFLYCLWRIYAININFWLIFWVCKS